MKGYQLNYSSIEPEMFEKKSREQKGRRIIKLLELSLGKDRLKKLKLLDLGSSSGIIDNFIASSFEKVIGIDIDEEAINYAKKKFKKNNLRFALGDVMKLKYANNSFDIVICTHIYEHVPNPTKLFDEIYRVLKPQGVCYLAAVNKFWIMEPHYDLPFLSWLPKNFSHYYVRFFNKANNYYETLESYWSLKKLTQKFTIVEYTSSIFKDPEKFGYNDSINSNFKKTLAYLFSPFAKYFAPTFFWILKKDF